jgi:hypothetical protein
VFDRVSRWLERRRVHRLRLLAEQTAYLILLYECNQVLALMRSLR